jgi:hypothetical protein
MKQIALSTVLLKIWGLALVFSVASKLSAGYAVGTIISFLESQPDMGLAYLGIVTLGYVLQLAAGICLMVYGGKVSKMLFKEDREVISSGIIDPRAILPVGICLIGVFFFVKHIPSAVPQFVQWFRWKAEGLDLQSGSVFPFQTEVIASLIMVLLSLVLIFRGKQIGAFISKNQRRESGGAVDATR